MSHTLQIQSGSQLIPVLVTIADYTLGGEQITLAEIAASSFQAAYFATVLAADNSLAVPLFPIISAGKVMLFRFVAGAPVEIPTTVGLNAKVFALVNCVHDVTKGGVL